MHISAFRPWRYQGRVWGRLRRSCRAGRTTDVGSDSCPCRDDLDGRQRAVTGRSMDVLPIGEPNRQQTPGASSRPPELVRPGRRFDGRLVLPVAPARRPTATKDHRLRLPTSLALSARPPPALPLSRLNGGYPINNPACAASRPYFSGFGGFQFGLPPQFVPRNSSGGPTPEPPLQYVAQCVHPWT